MVKGPLLLTPWAQLGTISPKAQTLTGYSPVFTGIVPKVPGIFQNGTSLLYSMKSMPGLQTNIESRLMVNVCLVPLLRFHSQTPTSKRRFSKCVSGDYYCNIHLQQQIGSFQALMLEAFQSSKPSGAISDQDQPQHDPDPPYYREVALSDVPSQYAEEVDTFRCIFSLPDPRESMPKSSTSIMGLGDEKGHQELRPRGPFSVLPLSSVIKCF